MSIQQEFDQVVSLLISSHHSEEATRLLKEINHSTVSIYSLPGQQGDGLKKESTIDLAKMELDLAIERGDHSAAANVSSLIDNLMHSSDDLVLLTCFLTASGCFSIYTDPGKRRLFGIRESKNTLDEEMEKYLKLRSLIQSSGVEGDIELDDYKVRNLFKQGQLQVVESC